MESPPSLRRFWGWTVGQLLAVTVGLALVAFAGTQYQRSQFDAYSNQLEAENHALMAIDEAKAAVEGAAFGLLYGVTDGSSPRQYAEVYDTASSQLDLRFERATEVITGTRGRAVLAKAISSWQEMDRGVLSSAGSYDSATHVAAIEAGLDPHAESVWRPFQAMSDDLRALRGQSAEDLDSRTQRVGMMFLDLDSFKAVNDSFGHRAGDAVLKVAADRLRAAARATDMVARLGGDEFAIALGCDRPDASRLAARIIAAFAEPIDIGQHRPVHVGCSAGIAFADRTSCRTYDDLAHQADVAMYCAKTSGKRRFSWYSADQAESRVSRAVSGGASLTPANAQRPAVSS